MALDLIRGGGMNFSFPSGSFGENVIIFGADKSSSVHVNNKINIF